MIISDRKIAANRRNAVKSTGPRTAVGRSRTRRNAWSHGLAAVHAHPSRRLEVEPLAVSIAGDSVSPDRLALAHVIAEAELELRRIEQARIALFGELLGGTDWSDANLKPRLSPELLLKLVRLERYKRRAWSKRKKALIALASSP